MSYELLFANSFVFHQSTPIASPMTFTIDGEANDNQVEVSQSSADDSSPLTCSPECPQSKAGEDYDYEYYGSHDADLEALKEEYEERKRNRNSQNPNRNPQNSNRNQQGSKRNPQGFNNGNQQNSNRSQQNSNRNQQSSNRSQQNSNRSQQNSNRNQQGFNNKWEQQQTSNANDNRPKQTFNSNKNRDDPYSVSNIRDEADIDVESVDVPLLGEYVDESFDSRNDPRQTSSFDFDDLEVPSTAECPGGNLDDCIDACPGFHAKAFSICVGQCGNRCP